MRPVILATASLAMLFVTPAFADRDELEAISSKESQTEQTAEPAVDAGDVKTADATAQPSPETANEVAEPQAKPMPEEAKRICRRIRTDASSRRKTKVCMTSDQWREANQGR